MRALLALAAACVATLPMAVEEAAAQLSPPQDCVPDPAGCLPEPPPLPEDECLGDPASCVPPPPPVEDCVQDPASCLPEPPTLPVDECLQDPASCDPPPPPIKDCAQHPASCAHPPSTVNSCVDDPERCLPGAKDDDRRGGDGDHEDHEGSTGPGNGADPPRRSAENASIEGDAPEGASFAAAGSSELASVETPVKLLAGTGGGLADRIARGLIDAGQRFAFPLILAAGVMGFLLVQGRIDRREPKLTAAPVDSRDDLILFR